MLAVCPACSRHTRGDACAFCGAPVRASDVVRLGRGSRAAIFAATAAAVTLACGARTDIGGEESPSTDAAEECQASAVMYGLPFLDACVTTPKKDASVEDVTAIPPYGIAPDE